MRLSTYALAMLPILLRAASRPGLSPRVALTVDEMILDLYNDTRYHASDPHQVTDLVKRDTPYWLENIHHQGTSAFHPAGYTVFRNVKDYGAIGNGVTDDTAAINAAISAGGRCGQGCASTTTTPAVVYFPAGTYLISTPIVDYYYTQLIGNPNNMPVLKATAGFSGFALIDADPYYTSNLNWGSTNVFYRQVRNLVFDLTSIPATIAANGIHWPTAQATSIENVIFQMSSAANTQHVGIFCESGSAGWMSDITFNGGRIGASLGNQQWSESLPVFNNCVTAISHFWNWGWTYIGLSINNCGTGIAMNAGGPSSPEVGSVILIDSTFTNTPVGIKTAYTPSSNGKTAGSLIIENVNINNVPVMVQDNGGGTILGGTGGSANIAGWGQGHAYTPNGPSSLQGSITPNARPSSLLQGTNYYTRSKPQYQNLPLSAFQSTRSSGAAGNGVADDTYPLQQAINNAAAAGAVLFWDAGTYLVTSTLTMPPGSKWVGESYSVIMSSGGFFNDMNNPRPVVRVGNPGQTGQVEWSDMIVSTQGSQAGAILIEWNLATSGAPSGMWDVHARIGGFAGSQLSVAQCRATSGANPVNANCIGGYMSMHVTTGATGLYMENVWLWTADHDIEDSSNTQISVYNGRGLYIESAAGTFWLYGTAVEHHTLYQYQFANTQNIFMAQIQTETPYYQPNPGANQPFPSVASLNDPTFSGTDDAWGLRILNSQRLLIYGAGLYSFFNDYSTTCSQLTAGENCQAAIFSIDDRSAVSVYNLNTIGSVSMINRAGVSMARYSDNVNVFPDTVALYRNL